MHIGKRFRNDDASDRLAERLMEQEHDGQLQAIQLASTGTQVRIASAK